MVNLIRLLTLRPLMQTGHTVPGPSDGGRLLVSSRGYFAQSGDNSLYSRILVLKNQ
jgi:hypothetical protein